LLDRKIDRKKAKITEKTSRFKIAVVMANPMTLIKQEICRQIKSTLLRYNMSNNNSAITSELMI